jgi:branched-chain amino acid transport system substrate-binding protein
MVARRLAAVVLFAAATVLAGCGGDKEPIRIGVISDCQGLFAYFWDSTLAAAEIPLLERGGTLAGKPEEGVEGAEVAGRPVELHFGCDDTNLPNTLAETRRLVENENVDVVVGPMLDVPGLIVRRYAPLHPEVTFVGPAGSEPLLTDASPNVFRFSPDASQYLGGLGAYAFQELGWRRAVIVGPDGSSGWTGAAGFVAEFCSLGGQVVDRLWPSYFSSDLASLVDELPDPSTYDGVLVSSVGGATGSFLARLSEREPDLAGRVLLDGWASTDPAVLEQLGAKLEGVVTAHPTPFGSSGAAWDGYLEQLVAAFPEAIAGTVFDLSYHDGMEAILTALEQVDGDLSDGGRRFRAALAGLELDSPVGPVRLDANHDWVGPNFLGRIELVDGKPVPRTIRTIDGVEQSFGGYLTASSPPPSRTEPTCHRAEPPPWASP